MFIYNAFKLVRSATHLEEDVEFAGVFAPVASVAISFASECIFRSPVEETFSKDARTMACFDPLKKEPQTEGNAGMVLLTKSGTNSTQTREFLQDLIHARSFDANAMSTTKLARNQCNASTNCLGSGVWGSGNRK